MIIRNQTHDALFILKKGSIIQVDTTCIVLYGKDNERTIIGRYPTEDRALEVLNDIYESIHSGNSTYSIPLS